MNYMGYKIIKETAVKVFTLRCIGDRYIYL